MKNTVGRPVPSSIRPATPNEMLRRCPGTGGLARPVRNRTRLERRSDLAARHHAWCRLVVIRSRFHLNHRRLWERRLRHAELEQSVRVLGGDHRRVDVRWKLETPYEGSIVPLDEMEACVNLSGVPS